MAAIEAVMVISLVLAPLCFGVAAYAMVLVDTARLDRAMQAGLFYIWNNPAGFTTAGVTTAATAGYGSASPTMTVQTTTACSCVSSGYSKVSTVSCTGSCPSGQTVATYATVTASATFTLPIVVHGLSSPLTRSVSGTVRTQ